MGVEQGMKKPSVILFNRVYPPVRGATGRLLRDLARGFARDGWDVTVVTIGPQDRKDYDGPVRVVRLRPVAGGRNIFSYALVWIRMLIKGLSLPRHDLIVTMTDPPLFVVAGRIMAKFKKCGHMHWCQDLYPDILPALGVPVPGPLMRFMKTLSRRSMKSCDRVVVIGRCMARHLTHSGMDPRRVSVIPNWPDVELTGAVSRRRILRASLPGQQQGAAAAPRPQEKLFRDAEPKFRILYAGNLGRAHPVDTILDAAAILAAPHPEIEFVFVGDGPRFEKLVQERARRGLQNIRFLPWQPASRLRELAESGDVHLISMEEEVAGMIVPSKLYSALAVGRPSIFVGPRNTETARLIKDFMAGSVVPQGEARQLAETIRHYRLNGDAWFAAQEGATRAGKIFVPEESIRAWLDRARVVVNIPLRFPKRRRKKAA